MIKDKNKMNKSGISIMISYVLLISIVLALSIGVFSWLKIIADIKPEIDCKDDTSVSIESYECFTDTDESVSNFILSLKNNGRFSVDGVIVIVSDDPSKTPTTYLIPEEAEGIATKGHYYFFDKLKPGDKIDIGFLNKVEDGSSRKIVDFSSIGKVEIQPFIIDKGDKIICQDAIKRIPIEGCVIEL